MQLMTQTRQIFPNKDGKCGVYDGSDWGGQRWQFKTAYNNDSAIVGDNRDGLCAKGEQEMEKLESHEVGQ
jgi:hypothetical protein